MTHVKRLVVLMVCILGTASAVAEETKMEAAAGGTKVDEAQQQQQQQVAGSQQRRGGDEEQQRRLQYDDWQIEGERWYALRIAEQMVEAVTDGRALPLFGNGTVFRSSAQPLTVFGGVNDDADLEILDYWAPEEDPQPLPSLPRADHRTRLDAQQPPPPASTPLEQQALQEGAADLLTKQAAMLAAPREFSPPPPQEDDPVQKALEEQAARLGISQAKNARHVALQQQAKKELDDPSKPPPATPLDPKGRPPRDSVQAALEDVLADSLSEQAELAALTAKAAGSDDQQAIAFMPPLDPLSAVVQQQQVLKQVQQIKDSVQGDDQAQHTAAQQQQQEVKKANQDSAHEVTVRVGQQPPLNAAITRRLLRDSETFQDPVPDAELFYEDRDGVRVLIWNPVDTMPRDILNSKSAEVHNGGYRGCLFGLASGYHPPNQQRMTLEIIFLCTGLALLHVQCQL